MTDELVRRLLAMEALARKLIVAGPFYDGIDDDFCAVCQAYFLDGDEHKPDCAYVELARLLGHVQQNEPADD